MKEKTFLGIGAGVFPTFNKEFRCKMVSDETDIKEA